MTVSVLLDDLATGEGLRRLRHHLPTKTKVELVERLVGAGLASVEAACLSNELRLADGATVLERLAAAHQARTIAGARDLGSERDTHRPELQATVGSQEHVAQALASGVQTLRVVVALSEASSRRLTGRTAAESWRLAEEVSRETRAKSKGADRRWCLVLASAFGCPLSGAVDRATVRQAVSRGLEMGASRVVLADSGGLATPASVRGLIEGLRSKFGDRLETQAELALQLAETRGLGLLNFHAAVETGVRRFETAASGVGGSPFDLGAPGLIATEDLVHACMELGYETRIDLAALIRIGRRFEEATGDRMASRMLYVEPRAALFGRFASGGESDSKTASGAAS